MLPIDYSAVVLGENDTETVIDLQERGWISRPELIGAKMFTLRPKQGISLPTVTVDLSPIGEIRRRLVYFSRVFGDVNARTQENSDFFRIYCLGWAATIEGKSVSSKSWIYPSGAIVSGADEPPFVDDLMEMYRQRLSSTANEALKNEGA